MSISIGGQTFPVSGFEWSQPEPPTPETLGEPFAYSMDVALDPTTLADISAAIAQPLFQRTDLSFGDHGITNAIVPRHAETTGGATTELTMEFRLDEFSRAWVRSGAERYGWSPTEVEVTQCWEVR